MHANEPKMAKKWEKKKKTEAFRPSDRKVLMVIGRDVIQNLNKNYHKGTLTPNKQLGQALNSIFRAMTRPKDDANYKQYKKYFPKYNHKLLNRLAKAHFDQPSQGWWLSHPRSTCNQQYRPQPSLPRGMDSLLP